ncbi:MAG: 16S rRNA (guanine(527)-N(7))-methyltransferase RsmG [Chloroflexi bacterium]|nr:16S rRNA (guanine(527)-N(7))-methyltransferase RsmG [Chloroflexota bacterium]MCL5026147.1 16S rRNA (guanine(527)-N(7))-methyltransferase RsmG [Chloroflexota bacterium]
MAASERPSTATIWTQRQRSALAGGAAAFGLRLGVDQLDRFHQYYDELISWNRRFNLTAITDPDEVLGKHFLDSLSCVLAFPPGDPQSLALIDVGTGAGFPGIPLKLALPGLHLALLEATQKKALFLSHVLASLGLADTTVLNGRAEELGQVAEYRERFDVAVSRAVAELAVLAEYCLPFVRVGGRFIAPKKTGIEEEVKSAQEAISILGGKLMPPISLADPTRQLIVVDKVRPTPRAYPRRAGLPPKRPLGRPRGVAMGPR